MKKLLVAAAALALTFGAVAEEQTGGEGMIGGVKTSTVAAGVVGVAVAAAIISNNRGSSIVDPGPGPTPTCNPGDSAPVNGICTGTTVTVTGTGTGTATTTAPVTFTYPAING
uniref:Uncharacterized protein n=1 Tax=Rheinheimera sp. BAL341 TaxID=1708203 RepID=A0A486XVF8_9GAMM